jgi:hypothetical protein
MVESASPHQYLQISDLMTPLVERDLLDAEVEAACAGAEREPEQAIVSDPRSASGGM